MECDFCKNRFMLHRDVYESEENISFFCPICGLPNKINTYFIPEVLEKAQQMTMNYMLEEVEQTLGKSIKQINKSGFIKMSMKSPKKKAEKELYTPSVEYIKCAKKCCNIDIKVMDIDKLNEYLESKNKEKAVENTKETTKEIADKEIEDLFILD